MLADVTVVNDEVSIQPYAIRCEHCHLFANQYIMSKIYVLKITHMVTVGTFHISPKTSGY